MFRKGFLFVCRNSGCWYNNEHFGIIGLDKKIGGWFQNDPIKIVVIGIGLILASLNLKGEFYFMKGKHIVLMLVLVFVVGLYGVAMSAEVTNVVARSGWQPDAQGGPTGKTVGQTGDASRGGYSRDLFFVGFDDPGQWVEWNMVIPEAGQYRLIIRYSTHEEPQFVRRNFKLRLAGEDIEAAYIDETYDLATGRVGSDEDRWMFFASDLLELKAGEHSLRMEYIFNPDEDDRQFSNVVMVGFVSVDPVATVLDQEQYIEALDNFLGL